MMEYTIFAISGIAILIILDHALKTDVLKLTKGRIIFWLYVFISLYLIELIAINRWWVIFPENITGLYLGFNIPIEEFGCVIIWILITLIPWQYFKKHIEG